MSQLSLSGPLHSFDSQSVTSGRTNDPHETRHCPLNRGSMIAGITCEMDRPLEVTSTRNFIRNGQHFGQNSRMVLQKIIPASATISELKKKAAESEEKAKQASEPEAAKLRKEALLYSIGN
jgi:hypothetical protein